MSNLEKVKLHFKENKKIYISCGVTALVTAAGVILLTKGQGSSTAVKGHILSWKPRGDIMPVTVNLIERSTPSKPVRLVGTDLYFSSLSEASRKTGHHLSQLSQHINGKIPDLNGDVFELLEPAS